MNRVSSNAEPTSLLSELLVPTAASELCRAAGELTVQLGSSSWPWDVDASLPLGPAELLPSGAGACSDGLFVEELSGFGESSESVRSIRENRGCFFASLAGCALP